MASAHLEHARRVIGRNTGHRTESSLPQAPGQALCHVLPASLVFFWRTRVSRFVDAKPSRPTTMHTTYRVIHGMCVVVLESDLAFSWPTSHLCGSPPLSQAKDRSRRHQLPGTVSLDAPRPASRILVFNPKISLLLRVEEAACFGLKKNRSIRNRWIFGNFLQNSASALARSRTCQREKNAEGPSPNRWGPSAAMVRHAQLSMSISTHIAASPVPTTIAVCISSSSLWVSLGAHTDLRRSTAVSSDEKPASEPRPPGEVPRRDGPGGPVFFTPRVRAAACLTRHPRGRPRQVKPGTKHDH